MPEIPNVPEEEVVPKGDKIARSLWPPDRTPQPEWLSDCEPYFNNLGVFSEEYLKRKFEKGIGEISVYGFIPIYREHIKQVLDLSEEEFPTKAREFLEYTLNGEKPYASMYFED